jgi:hypothetical protein
MRMKERKNSVTALSPAWRGRQVHACVHIRARARPDDAHPGQLKRTRPRPWSVLQALHAGPLLLATAAGYCCCY